ncbi:hypothetical protein AMJ50_00100 [Parcubacteria bacterium DG_74_3]|nr:MAG: hypothetical protein AMJ50_00100 [Parcubacteria bacterium DG_74_3]
MSLKEKIKEDLNIALKAKRLLETSTLRMVSAAIFNKEKEKRYKIAKEQPDLNEEELERESQLTDEELFEVLSSELKKRKEAILEFEKGGRVDLVKKEKKETEILKKYLPQQLSLEEIKKMAQETIKAVGAQDIKDMGKVMGQLVAKTKGKAEGGQVSKIVRELLEK